VHHAAVRRRRVREIEGKDKELNTIFRWRRRSKWLAPRNFPRHQVRIRVTFDATKRVGAELSRFRGLALSPASNPARRGRRAFARREVIAGSGFEGMGSRGRTMDFAAESFGQMVSGI
jgi:hypothetical protein